MACKVEDVIAIMEELAPLSLAEDWDNVGLLLGSSRSEVEGVLVSLDAQGEVLAEAGRRGAGLLICHHPPIFRPLYRVDTDEPAGSFIEQALTSGISVYAAHTNLDGCKVGVNAALAEAVGLPRHRPLCPAPGKEGLKLVTFLPPGEAGRVSEALFEAGAGEIGEYGGCSFRVEGTGTFTPGPESHPAYGKAGETNRVREVRLEVVVSRRGLDAALKALVSSHPYEEPAYDIYSLRVPPAGGMGAVGELPQALELAELARVCSKALGNPDVRLAGDPRKSVRHVAVCGGSGGDLLPAAAEAGAEVMITGDVGYHKAVEAVIRGLAVIDAGHYHTERPVVAHLAALLEERTGAAGLQVRVYTSHVDTCPWTDGGGR
ncbi:MAG: Nif3-like dinuclear metal center hexameric protein [Actinomycetota bacterium]|nr:Nif3-like dinuclear metal center hexameric protein [Actinomycetota bacterium]